MPDYYTQKAEVEKDGKTATYTVCGVAPAHDHGKSNDFSKDITAILKTQYPGADVTLTSYKSKQPKPTSGNVLEFKHDAKKKKWVLK
jgi:hypothetical protein